MKRSPESSFRAHYQLWLWTHLQVTPVMQRVLLLLVVDGATGDSLPGHLICPRQFNLMTQTMNRNNWLLSRSSADRVSPLSVISAAAISQWPGNSSPPHRGTLWRSRGELANLQKGIGWKCRRWREMRWNSEGGFDWGCWRRLERVKNEVMGGQG